MAMSLAALAVAVLSLTLIGSDTAYATTFDPHAIVNLDDTTPGANSNINTKFCIDFDPTCSLPDGDLSDSNFGATIAFTPEEFFVASEGDVDIGSWVIFLASQATLGLLGGPCSPSGLTPQFNMLNATTNINGPTVTFDDDPGDPGDTGEVFEGTDSNVYAVGAQLPQGVTMYPAHLLRTFPGLQPRARLYGQTQVVGVDVALNFLVFDLPGPTGLQLTDDFLIGPGMGYPSVTILQNAADPDAAPVPGSAITDFCSPLQATTTTFGMSQPNPQTGGGGGKEFRRNPDSDITVNFIQFAASQRDADNDGFENSFDTCPWDTNLENPRLGGAAGDPDLDGIDSACDPAPSAVCGPGLDGPAGDCDNDGFPNRGDNCPLVPNGEDQDNQADRDSDAIGDACDGVAGLGNPQGLGDPDVPDGHLHVQCIVNAVDIGAGGGNPPAADDYLCTEDGASIIGGGGPPPTNTAPVCNGVEVTAFADTTTPSFSLNCSDADGDSLNCSVVADGSKGSVSITNCESATYTPNPGESGTDSFTYKANDSKLDSDTATGAVTILGDTDGDGVPDIDDQCPDTPGDEEVDPSGCSNAQLEEAKVEVNKEWVEEATAGLNLRTSLDTVIAGGSTAVLAICADENDNPIPDLDITFKIDSQPGSDADLEGAAEVTKTSDAEGVAEAKLNVGSTAGDIVVSAAAEGCEAKTITVAVKEATEDGATGHTEVAGATTGTGGTGGTGGAGGPDTGIGSLAPLASGISAWAAIASALGGAGLLGGLGALASRLLRRHRQ